MEETTLVIKGMTSDQCMASIRSALLDLAGVYAVELVLGAEKGIVTYDETEVTLRELTSTIQGKGYEVSSQ